MILAKKATMKGFHTFVQRAMYWCQLISIRLFRVSSWNTSQNADRLAEMPKSRAMPMRLALAAALLAKPLTMLTKTGRSSSHAARSTVNTIRMKASGHTSDEPNSVKNSSRFMLNKLKPEKACAFRAARSMQLWLSSEWP